MPYTADVSRANPACFLFLIDQSGSMTGALAGQPGQRKIDQAAAAVNRILDTLAQRCSQGMASGITLTSACLDTIPTIQGVR